VAIGPRLAIGIGASHSRYPLSSLSVLVFASTLLCLLSPPKMVRPRDQAVKRKATSPTTTPELEVDVAALRQHRRPA